MYLMHLEPQALSFWRHGNSCACKATLVGCARPFEEDGGAVTCALAALVLVATFAENMT
jgi:hypothetical protein